MLLLFLWLYLWKAAWPPPPEPEPAKTDVFISFADLGHAVRDDVKVEITEIFWEGHSYIDVQERCQKPFSISQEGGKTTQRALQLQVSYGPLEAICLAEPKIVGKEKFGTYREVRNGVAIELVRVAAENNVHQLCDDQIEGRCADVRVQVNHLTLSRDKLSSEQVQRLEDERSKEGRRNIIYAAMGAVMGVLLTLFGTLIQGVGPLATLRK